MNTESNDNIQKALALFPIKPFMYERDIKQAMSACSFCLVASSKSGKTTLLKHIISKLFDGEIKVLMTMSPSAEIYASMKKDCAFSPTYLPDIIKTCYTINKHTKNHYKFLIIIDDVVGFKADKEMTKLMALYRNSGMSCVIAGQDMQMLNPTGRANCNNMLLGKLNSAARVESVVKDYCRFFFPKNLSLDEKCELYNRLTMDHCFLHINNLENTMIRVRLSASQVS